MKEINKEMKNKKKNYLYTVHAKLSHKPLPFFILGRLADLADVGCRRALGALLDGELNRVTLLQ